MTLEPTANAMGSKCKCSFYKHGQTQSLGHPTMSFKAGIVSLLVLGLRAKACLAALLCASNLASLNGGEIYYNVLAANLFTKLEGVKIPTTCHT